VDPAGKKEKPAGFMEYMWILMSLKHNFKTNLFVEKGLKISKTH